MNLHNEPKAAMVRARIQSDVKIRAEKILNGIGISATQAVNMLYKRVIQERGWPCELREFNDETLADLKASDRGEALTTFDNVEDMIADLHSQLEKEEVQPKKQGR